MSLHYIIHVAPQNLRAIETDHSSRPVWVVRPECARDRSALVYAWSVVNGCVRSHADPSNPLPDTGGHGWAYIECDTLLIQTDPSNPDGWTDAAYLFTGACSPIRADQSLVDAIIEERENGG